MAQGLSVPIEVSKSGGAVLIKGDDQLIQTLLLAFADGDNDNPFNDIGLLPDQIFDIADSQAQARMRRKIEDVFDRFEIALKARLASGGLKFTFDSSKQTMTADISMINLETDRPSEFGAVFSAEGDVSLA